MIYKIIFLNLLLNLSSFGIVKQKDWVVKENIKTPESTYYDKSTNQIFIANIDGEGIKKDGNGHISIVSPQGEMINSSWIKGLNAPKGMRAQDGILWVSDIDEVIKIDIKEGKILNKFLIKGAKFLNDIAISKSNDVYISDTLGSAIYKIYNDKVDVFVMGDEFESPNGLLIKDNNLYVAAWGLTTDWSTTTAGRLYKIDLANKKKVYITKKPLGHLDGLEFTSEESFLVSDWSAGLVYKIDQNGNSKVIYKGKKGLADIAFIKSENLLVIPHMNDNEIIGHIIK